MKTKDKNPLLLIVDMQNVYAPGQAWECPNYLSALTNIEKLLNAHVTENVCATRFIAPTSPIGVWEDYNQKYSEINGDLTANELDSRISLFCSQNKYPIIDKSTYSSYKKEAIRNLASGVPYVIVTGVTTGCCVLSTVMDLIDAGIYVVLIKDATAGSSEECEEAVWETLSGLSPLHLSMTTTEEYLASI